MCFSVGGYNLPFIVYHHGAVIIAVILRIFNLLIHTENNPDAVIRGKLSHACYKWTIQRLRSSQADCPVGAGRKMAHKALRKNHHIRLITLHRFSHRFFCVSQVLLRPSLLVKLGQNKFTFHNSYLSYRIDCYSSASGQTATNNASKRQKTPLILVESLLFIASRRQTQLICPRSLGRNSVICGI